jgi:hypothetical protein
MIEKYLVYSDELQRYESIKNRLINLVRSANRYTEKELETTYKHLEIAQKYLQYHPTDEAMKIKPLIDILKPKDFYFIVNNEHKMQVKFNFEKTFKKLSDLHKFEKKFKKIFENLNTDNLLEYKKLTKYSELKFIVSIYTKVTAKKKPTIRRRRRR